MTSSDLPARLEELITAWRKEAADGRQALCRTPPEAYGAATATILRIEYCAERLEALVGAEPPADQWQPIETAPKDGTHLLVCDAHKPYTAFWGFGQNPPTVGHYFEPGWHLSVNFDGEHSEIQPTHWMSLPAPPGAASPRVGAPAETLNARMLAMLAEQFDAHVGRMEDDLDGVKFSRALKGGADDNDTPMPFVRVFESDIVELRARVTMLQQETQSLEARVGAEPSPADKEK